MIVLLAAPAVDLDLESIAAANSHGLVSDFSVSLDHCPICSARTGALALASGLALLFVEEGEA